MLICTRCSKELRCIKNGVGVHYQHGHVYPGDAFQCPTCRQVVINTNPSPIQDPNFQTQDVYKDMDSNATTYRRNTQGAHQAKEMSFGNWLARYDARHETK